MDDLNSWQSKFKYCGYSVRLLRKILLLNKKVPKQSQVNISDIKKAIYYARKYHGPQMRQSGEPYYWHPLAVAEMVAPYCFKTDILVTSILHDTIEDTEITKDMLAYIFDEEIANQVDDLTRVKSDRKISAAEMVNLLCIQEKKDLLLIKYFDRLHNMQTISAKSPEKNIKITKETFKAFISLGIFLHTDLPKLFEVHDKLLNLCYQSLPVKQSYMHLSLIEKSTDNYQLPFLVFQSEKPPT